MIKLLKGSGASIGVWIILGILALAFGLTFGVPSDSISLGKANYGKAFGAEIRNEDFAYQSSVVAVTINGLPKDQRLAANFGLREETFDSLLERRVLADAATELGLAADTRDAELMTRDGNFIHLGFTSDFLGSRAFNYETLFKGNWLRQFGTSEKAYLEKQRQELLARNMRELLTLTLVAPEPELREAYEADVDRISLRYVSFDAGPYEALIDPTEEEKQAYVDEHAEQLEALFTSLGPRFTKLPKQLHLRFLKVVRPPALPADASPEAAATHAKLEADAQATLATALDRLNQGEDFRRVAREFSDDLPTARGGGDYDWASIAGTGSGLDPVIDTAAADLKDGQVSARLEGEGAYYLVQVVGRREGNVALAQGLLELAEEAIKRERGRALAKQTAEEALLNVKGGKTLAELYPPPGAKAALAPSATLVSAQPQMELTGMFKRNETIPGLGTLPALSKAVWAAEANTGLLDQSFETPKGFVVAGIEERETATDEDYAEKRKLLARDQSALRASRATSRFAKRRCVDAVATGDIKLNNEQLARLFTYDIEGEDEAVTSPIPYRACERVGNRGGPLIQLKRQGLFQR